MSIKEALEVFIKIFRGDGTQFVKDASDFHLTIDMKVTSICGDH